MIVTRLREKHGLVSGHRVAKKKTPLARILDALEAHAGPPPAAPSADPFELVLWENVAYLVPDAKRAVAALGGMHPDLRVGKLLRIATLARDRFGGDVSKAARLPFREARKAFTRFPGIGEPGAEKVLLFSGAHPVLAMDSNVLRVLRRLGYGEDRKDYGATCRAVQAAVEPLLDKDCRGLVRAYQLLRRHGQELCKTTRPRCPACPVQARCAYARGVLTPSA